MDEDSSKHDAKNKDSITKDIIINLDTISGTDHKYDFTNINFSSILCFTKCWYNIVIITDDCKALAMGDNERGEISVLLPREEINNFVPLDFKDKNGNLWYPISAVCGLDYTLYMVSNVPYGFKKRLIYSARKLKAKFPLFLNIEKVNPIALFGGIYNCAAIDTEGAILYIPISTRKKPQKLIKPIFLPNNEKAVSLACGEETLYVLSHSGKIFISNGAKGKKHKFIQIVEMSKINIVQLSGISNHFIALSNEGKIFVCGSNYDYRLGLGYDNGHVDDFTEISTLTKHRISNVYAGWCHSLFQTVEGKLFAAGDHNNINNIIDKDAHYESYAPHETTIKSGACFCIPEFHESAIFFGFNPKMCPNKTVEYETKIGLFGGSEKTKIAQTFTHNESSFNNYEYTLHIEISKLKLTIALIDESKYNVNNDRNIRFNFYQQMQFFLFFFDVSNFSLSLKDLNNFYEEANAACNGDFKFAIVTYSGSLPKSNEIRKKFKCKIFEVNLNDMETVNEPFYYFIRSMDQKKEIIKSNIEHYNPFLNLNSKNINIGLFGDKTKLAFRYVYGDYYEQYYLNYKNFSNVDLVKVIECDNQVRPVAVIDSSMIGFVDKKYYSSVQGLIFVFKINILLSNIG